MDAIILSGGFGKRLMPLTKDIPKPMVPVNGKPMLQYHIDWLKRFRISRIIVACGYMWEEIKKHYGSTLIYSVETEPLGTGGAIRQAMDHIDSEEFIVLNSDDVSNLDIGRFLAVGSNAIALSRFNSNFGIVDVEDNIVTRFRQKPLLPYWASMGAYVLSDKIKPLLPTNGAIETETFPKIKLKAYKHTGWWMTVNTVKDLEELEASIKQGLR